VGWRTSLVIASAAIVAVCLPTTALASGGQYVVLGKPLVGGKHPAGRTITIFTKPAVVRVAGCRSSRQRVRVKGTTRISALIRCPGRRGSDPLTAKLRGGVLHGTLGSGRKRRAFRARLRSVPGVVLRGKQGLPASDAIVDVDRAVRHPGGDLGSDGVVRTELVVTFAGGATVARVNAALKAVGARIVESLPHDLRVAVAVPDAGTRAAVNGIARVLRAQKGVARVDLSSLVAPASLPPGMGSPPNATEDRDIRHLIGARMPAAWNAMAAMTVSQPTVIVVDFFGGGPVSHDVDATVTGNPSPVPGFDPEDHGYHVVGIIAANHIDDSVSWGPITGAFPGRTRMVVENLQGETGETVSERIIRLAEATVGPIVLNTSLQNTTVDTAADARADGASWARRVRAAGLENRLFNASAAGNHAGDSTLWSERNAASVRTDLGTPRLRNTVSVENVTTASTPDHRPGCLFSGPGGSNFNGDIGVPGTDVWSFDHLGLPLAMTGTSMAAPLVAGLVEYLWTLAPDLRAQDLRNALIATASPAVAGCTVFSKPLLDAYAATLSLDQATMISPATAPIRLAILDRDDDGDFDEDDLTQWADVLEPSGPVTVRTFGRGDANGDGFVGGDGTRGFDLDRIGSTRAGAASFSTDVSQTVEGAATLFDETALTDAQIVCYYAYSTLYTASSPDNRKALVDPDTNCPPAPFTVLEANATTYAYGKAFMNSPLPLGTTDEQGVPVAVKKGSHVDPATGGHGSISVTPPDVDAQVGDDALGAHATTHATQDANWTTNTTSRVMTLSVTGSADATGHATDDDLNDATSSNVLAFGGIDQAYLVHLSRPATYALTASMHSSSHVAEDAPRVRLTCGANVLRDLQAATLSVNVSGALPVGDCELVVRMAATGEENQFSQQFFPMSSASGSATLTLTPA
jgi:hypothetical protein